MKFIIEYIYRISYVLMYHHIERFTSYLYVKYLFSTLLYINEFFEQFRVDFSWRKVWSHSSFHNFLIFGIKYLSNSFLDEILW